MVSSPSLQMDTFRVKAGEFVVQYFLPMGPMKVRMRT
jgi:hypothetical protein